MKTCRKCNITKEYDNFNKNNAMKDGKASYCKPCQKEYADNYYEKKYKRKYPKEKVIGDTRHCTLCKTYKPFDAFKGSNLSWCSECKTEHYRKKNDETRKFPRKVNENEKIHCRKCERYLDQSKFWGKLTYCKECSKLVGHSANLKRFGLTVEDYIDLEKSQNGLCKICKEPEKHNRRLSVDHDHSCCSGANSCGKCIRGLLCSICNKTLGMVKDDIKILEEMINYLKPGK